MKKWLDRIKSASRLVKMTQFLGWSKGTCPDMGFEIISQPPKGKVLVLSPHPDDDVLGAGGAIIKHRQQGDMVAVAYFFDCTPERHREAVAAAKILGVAGENLVFAPSNLTTQIKAFRPEIIYLPSPVDNHPRHQKVSRMVVDLPLASATLMVAYEVWQPIFPNRLLDISDAIEQKKKAILVHQSQLKERRYDRAILGLNQYRGAAFGAGEYAEGFWVCEFGVYKKLIEMVK